jgi:putative DNA primase/helicase
MGGWLLWDGSRWQNSKGLMHMTAIRDFLRIKAQHLTEWAEWADGDEKQKEKWPLWAKARAHELRSDSMRAALERTAQSNPASLAIPEQFDADRMLLGTPEGTVDLRTGELRASDRADYITRQTAVAPAATGTMPRTWFSFLDRIFNGDAELIGLMQRLAGYALTGETREHKVFIFHGTGRNGKSTLLSALQGIMNDYATSVSSGVFLESRNSEHPTGLAGLRGARLAVGSELPAGRTWNEEVVKALTGDDKISARFMRQDFFEFDPQCTLIIPGNRKPSFKDVGPAMRARVVLVPFTVHIPEAEQDRGLDGKLKAEWPAILRWAIEGAVRWQRDGLCIPESVRAASRDYMDAEDHIGNFLADATEARPDGKVAGADLFERFKEWQEEQGIRGTWTRKAMTTALQERGVEYFNANGMRGFKGLMLRSQPIDDASWV